MCTHCADRENNCVCFAVIMGKVRLCDVTWPSAHVLSAIKHGSFRHMHVWDRKEAWITIGNSNTGTSQLTK